MASAAGRLAVVRRHVGSACSVPGGVRHSAADGAGVTAKCDDKEAASVRFTSVAQKQSSAVGGSVGAGERANTARRRQRRLASSVTPWMPFPFPCM